MLLNFFYSYIKKRSVVAALAMWYGVLYYHCETHFSNFTTSFIAHKLNVERFEIPKLIIQVIYHIQIDKVGLY